MPGLFSKTTDLPLRIIAVIAVAALAACGVVGTVGEGAVSDAPAVQGGDPGTTVSPFITDGQPDPGHPSVGRLSSQGSGCTATLIGKRTVLTAAHCVHGQSATFTLGGTPHHAASIVRHPGYAGGNHNDLALITLQGQVQGVTPSPIHTGAPHTGQAITLVGYGKTGEYNNDYGTKRVGLNTISMVGQTTFSFTGKGNVCNGDSGGPTFVNLGGQEVVAGVHSTKSGMCGTGGTDMRVDAYRQWIVQTAGGDVVLPGGGNPGGGAPPPPQHDPSIAREGEGCWKRSCQQGLRCVAVYQGKKIVGKFCMERCAKLGQDPNCDGAESCVKSHSAGRVCFAQSNPQGGYTSNSPGAQQGGGSPGGGGTTPPPAPPGGGACGNQQESQVFKLLNQVRAQHGRPPLKCDPVGVKVARAHSSDMCSKGYFSHTSLDGRRPWDRLKAGGATFSSAGENIAMGYRTPMQVHNGWMNSSGHRANMLGSAWTRVGIGYVACGGKPYWTEVFMR